MPRPALLLGTGLVTATDYPYSIVVGGVEVAPTKAELESIEIEDSGDDEAGRLTLRVWDAASSLTLREQGVVTVQENSSDQQVFGGVVQVRRYAPAAVGRYIDLEAVSFGTLLDETLVVRERRPAESDRARALYLWGKYARWPLSGDVQFVTQTNASVAADDLVNMTLRSALRQTAALAGASVRFYVDPLGRLHWFTGTEGSMAAPFNINVALAPGGGNIAPDNLHIERDATIRNRTYVRGATAAGSGWFQDDASVATYGPRETYIDAPSADTAAKAESIARLYFGRVAQPRTRGSFATEEPYNGWRGGQYVTVTDPQNGLSAESFRIARVTTRFTKGTGTKRYTCELGSVRAASSDIGDGLGISHGIPSQVTTSAQVDTTAGAEQDAVQIPLIHRYVESVPGYASSNYGEVASAGGAFSLRAVGSDTAYQALVWMLGNWPSAAQAVFFLIETALVLQSTLQILGAASDTIEAKRRNVVGISSSVGNLTMSSTPTISDPGTDGVVLVVVNTDTTDTVTLQDAATLPGSGLRLSTTTFAMGRRDSLTLLRSGGEWIEIARTNAL